MPESVNIPSLSTGLSAFLHRVRRIGFHRLVLLGKTFCLLLAAKIALRVIPVDKVLSWRSTASLPLGLRALDQAAECQLVRWAVTVICNHSPIEFVCFPQSLAARALLHRRGVQTQLFYGAARKAGVLVTHTWLKVGEGNVVGGEIAGDFSVLRIY